MTNLHSPPPPPPPIILPKLSENTANNSSSMPPPPPPPPIPNLATIEMKPTGKLKEKKKPNVPLKHCNYAVLSYDKIENSIWS